MHGSQTWVEELQGEPYQVAEALATIEQLEPITRLYTWSLNYEPGANPWCVMLDLIGWSEEELGEIIVRNPQSVLGYSELGMLADALQTYSTSPGYASAAITALLRAERGDVSGEINDEATARTAERGPWFDGYREA
jgi:hypothetical protein